MEKNDIFLQITPFFPSYNNFRGPFVLDQSKAIERNSAYKVIVIKIVPFNSKETDYIYDGVEVIIYKAINLPGFVFPFFLNHFNALRLKKLIKRKGINNIKVINGHVLYLSGILAVKVAEMLDEKPVKLIQHHGYDIFSCANGVFANNRFHSSLLIRKGLKYIKKSDCNIGVSKSVLKKINKYANINSLNTYALYNGVDKRKFFKKSEFKPNHLFTIGCVGNFWKLKDQLTLIKSVQYLIKQDDGLKIEVVFVGTGPLLVECKRFIEINGLEKYFTFIDSFGHECLNEFYNGLDLFVLPSFYEALGCVYLEAYSAGVPFIGVFGQGIEELIPNSQKESFLISKGDYKQLAFLIEQKMKLQANHELKMNLAINVDIDELISNFLHYLSNLNNVRED